MNRCSAQLWKVTREVSAALTAAGIKHVLVGTAALAALGKSVIHPRDVDFLVGRLPVEIEDEFEFLGSKLPHSAEGDDERDAEGGKRGASYEIEGVKVDLLLADEQRPRLLDQPRRVLDGTVTLIDAVPVGEEAAVLRLKELAGRPKDKSFLEIVREEADIPF